MTVLQRHLVRVLAVWAAIDTSARAAITFDRLEIGPQVGIDVYGAPAAINAAGQVLGNTGPLADDTFAIWVYDPQTGLSSVAGPTDADHTSSSGERGRAGWFMTDSGVVVGEATQFGPLSYAFGSDVFTHDPATVYTRVVSPTDAAHTKDGYRQSGIVAVTPSGQVVGESVRADSPASSLNYDAWIYSPTNGSTKLIGLTDAAHTPAGGVPDNRVWGANAAGIVIGSASRTEGQFQTDAWVYNSATDTYRTTGLLDADHTGGYGSNHRPVAVNAIGQVIGTSARATGGTDAWFDANDGRAPRQIGLTDADHSWTPDLFGGPNRVSDNEPTLINPAGRVIVGTADRGTSTDYTLLGHDAWAYSPSTDQTKLIGLTDADHTGSKGQRDDTPLLMNASGLTIGVSDRYFDGGPLVRTTSDLWAYDPSTGLTTAIDMGLLGRATRSWALDDDGRLVGAYIDGDAFGGGDTYGLFTWTAADGVQLIDLPAGYHVSDGAQIVMNGADQFAVQVDLPSARFPTATTTFLFSPVPEPTSVAVLGGGAAWACLRRGRGPRGRQSRA